MKYRIFILLVLLAVLPAWAQQRATQSSAKFEISGKVVNAVTGDVVRGARVRIAPTTRGQDFQTTDSAADGSFIFRNLAPGKYVLGAQRAGYPQQLFEQHGPFNTGIAVGPNKVSTDILFRLPPEGSISGRVLDEHNEPARNAQVLLFEKSTDSGKRQVERRSQTQTDDLGEYHLTHLHAGTYYLAVSAQPWYSRYLQGRGGNFGGGSGPGQPKPDVDPALDVAYPVTYYPNGTDPDGAGAVVLRAGDRISADFNLTPVQSLHLTVHNSGEGPPIQPNIRERVFGEPWGLMQPVFNWRGSGPNGPSEIDISGIAPGDYELMAMPRGGRDGAMNGREVSLLTDGEIDTSAGDTSEGIHGKLKFDGGDVPENPIIQLRDLSSGRMMGSRADENGEFTIQPQHAGRYVISLGNAPGYAIRTISGTGARINGRTLDFTSTQPVELVIAASEGVGVVNGTVMEGDKLTSGAMVVLVPSDVEDNLSLFRRDQSDSDGSFTLRDVVPGTYTAIALQNGWDMEWGSAEALRPYLAKGTRVQITGKQQLDIKIAAQ